MTEDLDAFFGDLSVSATIVTGTSTSTANVYFDSPSTIGLAGAVVMDAPAIVAQESAGLARGSTVTISGSGYTVRLVAGGSHPVANQAQHLHNQGQ